MFKNEQKITKIVMHGVSHNFCPLGQANYTNRFTMEFYPDDLIADYLEVEEFIKSEINDKDLIIEDAISLLFNYLVETFEPKGLKVSSLVLDAKHPEVLVERGERYA